MFNFRKTKKGPSSTQASDTTWLSRLQAGLTRTRRHFSQGLANLILGKKTIDDEVFEKLETLLLTADVGVTVSQQLLENITQQVTRKELKDPQSLVTALQQELTDRLVPYSQPLTIDTTHKPFVLLMVGVNGAGKTTSIAKIAHYFKQQGKKVMLAAGDTFRAAAIEQLQTWGERNQVPVVAQQIGSDSASVIYDALQSAMAKNIDLLIADTAGRLHTQEHLMAELQKIKRVIQKVLPDAPHETMLVIDASNGQNALTQAEKFNQVIGLTGITLTKLDGTAKGGIIFAITNQMRLPIRFVGVGEKIDDLKPFQAQEFIDALFQVAEAEIV